MLGKNYSTLDQLPSAPLPSLDRQNKSTLDMYRTGKFSHGNPDRPSTSFFLVHRLHTAGQHRSVQLADQSEIESTEQSLEATYQLDLNSYLHKKFRNFLIRKNESSAPKPTLLALQNPEMLNTFCSKMEVSAVLQEEEGEPVRPKRAIETAYLVNAKERIVRLVEMKRQRETTYSKLRETIQERCRSKKRGFHYICARPLNTPEDKQLNQRLKNEYQNQLERYRERLRSKVKSLKKEDTSHNYQ